MELILVQGSTLMRTPMTQIAEATSNRRYQALIPEKKETTFMMSSFAQTNYQWIEKGIALHCKKALWPVTALEYENVFMEKGADCFHPCGLEPQRIQYWRYATNPQAVFLEVKACWHNPFVR